MELLWDSAHLLLPGPSLSQRERQRGMEEREDEEKNKNKTERGRVRKGWKKEAACLFQTVGLINIHQCVFHNFKQKGTKPTQGQHRQG